MCKFNKLIIKKSSSVYKNIEYLPEVINLYAEYKKYLIDDYTQEFSVDKVILEIEKTRGYFWIILSKENEFAGFAYLDNWIGSQTHKHSAEITTCFKKKFWGSFTKICAKKFVKYCFKKYKLKKLKAVIFPDNYRVLKLLKSSGFKKEARLQSETMRNKKLQDIDIYSIIKE